jgi:ParB family transcriptional regulator, chromosome partitioning protein
MQKRDRKGLGRGLSALMADIQPVETAVAEAPAPRGERLIPVERIAPNPDQPRRAFSEDALSELAASIREKGIIQPLIVRPDPAGGGGYQIVAGERRWRAAQRAQVHEVPVIVRDFDDTEVLEVAIIENIQRADLNPVEEAQGYRQLMDRFGHTQEQLASAMGKSRSHIANLMRLLGLPGDVLDMLRDGLLSAGHARALITTGNPSELAGRQWQRDCRSARWRSLPRSAAQAGRAAGRRNPRWRRTPTPVRWRAICRRPWDDGFHRP